MKYFANLSLGTPMGNTSAFWWACLASLHSVRPTHLLGHAERRPSLVPAGIKGRVGQYLCNLAAADAALLCPHQMILEGSIRQPCAISAVTVNNERSRADSCSSQLQTPPNKTSSLGSANFGAGSPGPSLTAACFFMACIPSSQVFLRDLFVFVASGFPASSGLG